MAWGRGLQVPIVCPTTGVFGSVFSQGAGALFCLSEHSELSISSKSRRQPGGAGRLISASLCEALVLQSESF